jgi:hypothetical protein
MGPQQVRDTCGAVDRFGAWPIAIARGLRAVDLVRAFQRQKNFRRKHYSRGLFSNRWINQNASEFVSERSFGSKSPLRTFPEPSLTLVERL